MAARALQECRLLVRRGLILLAPLAFVAPRGAPLVLAMLALGAWGEWVARRPALTRSTTRTGPPLARHEFVAAWLLDCLGYSLGWIEGHLRAGMVRNPRR
jgi:hypothetical protein